MKPKALLIGIIVGLMAAAGANVIRLPMAPYIGAGNTEYHLYFHGRVIVPASHLPTGHELTRAVDSQLKYLPGPMQFGTRTFMSPRTGGRTLTNQNAAPLDKSPGLYTIDYDFEGPMIADPHMPAGLDVILPLRPDR